MELSNLMQTNLYEILDEEFKDLQKDSKGIATVLITLIRKRENIECQEIVAYLKNIQILCTQVKTKYLGSQVIFKNFDNPAVNIFLYKLDDLLNTLSLNITHILSTSNDSNLKANIVSLKNIARDIQYIKENLVA